MTPQEKERREVAAGNILIAEFIGGKFTMLERNFEPSRSWTFPENTIPDLGIYVYDEDLYFHSSWDWLMPVVEKIESLFDNYITVKIYDTRCTIEIGSQYAMAFNIQVPETYKRGATKIEATWLAVIDFIKFHNQTNHELQKNSHRNSN